MSGTDKALRSEAMLGEVAELALMVARELAVRLRGSEDVGEAVALAGAFNKASRAVRLTLALDAKLDREAARDAAAAAREAEARAEGEAQAQAEAAQAAEPWREADPVEARKARVRGLLNRLLWNEAESDQEDYEVLVDDLDEAALSADFTELPIEALARRVIADMGLTGDFALSLGEVQKVQAPAAPARALEPADTG
jgi:hypothetical protein